jgi:hypothetical protein
MYRRNDELDRYCIDQGVTKRCRLSWLTNSALVLAVYEPKCGVSANENSCTHGARIYTGDLTPYLTWT